MARNKKHEKIVRIPVSEAQKRRGSTNWARMLQEDSTEKKKDNTATPLLVDRVGPGKLKPCQFQLLQL